jgi:hypothetical protein
MRSRHYFLQTKSLICNSLWCQEFKTVNPTQLIKVYWSFVLCTERININISINLRLIMIKIGLS